MKKIFFYADNTHYNINNKKFLIFSFYVFLCFTLQINSTHSDLNLSFGTLGIAESLPNISTASGANALAMQGDNKILIAGSATIDNSTTDIIIARYNSDGLLDTSFGSQGIVDTPIGEQDSVLAMVLQPDGKIVAVGRSSINGFDNATVIRYNTDGTLDKTFGTNGITLYSQGDGAGWVTVSLQSNGNIVVGGIVVDSGLPRATLACYTSTGILNNSFGTNGIVQFAGASVTAVSALTVQADDKILITGYFNASSGNRSYIVRYTQSGTPDTTFGTNSVVLFTTFINQPYAIALQPDGKIVMTGEVTDSSPQGFLRRYLNNGAIDTAFGTNGIVFLANGNLTRFNAVAIQSDDKIVVAGVSDTEALLARYTQDGNLDNSFGANGIITNSSNNTSSYNGVQLASDGTILAAGFSSENFLLVSYYPNNTPFISITNPADGSTLSARTTTLNGKSSEFNSTINIYINNVLYNTVTSNLAGVWDSGTSYTLSGDTGSVKTEVVDGIAVIASATSTFDLPQAQSITIDNPTNGSTLAQAIFTISGHSSQSNAQVEITIDGDLFETVTTDSNGMWVTGSTSLLTNDSHTIAADLIVSGSTVAIDSITVLVSAQDKIIINTPTITHVLSVPILSNISGICSEKNMQVVIYLDGALDDWVTSDDSGTWSLSGTSSIATGKHVVHAELLTGSIILASASLTFTVT